MRQFTAKHHHRVLLLLALTTACQYDAAVLPGLPPPPSPPTAPPPPPAAEGLWTVSGSAGAILGLGADRLVGTGNADPTVTIVTSSGRLSAPGGIAFDRSGMLWIANQIEDRLLGFSPSLLGGSGVVPASVIITPVDGSLVQPGAIAFDAAHRLWVANTGNGTLVRYDSGQLVGSGSPSAVVTISGLRHPAALAFDASGALWVSDYHEETVVKYLSSQLATSGSPAPAVILSGTGTTMVSPMGLAFDPSGKLWVASPGNRTIVAFTPTQLATSGSPVPAIVLQPTEASLALPVALAWSATGDLWVMNADGAAERFRSDALATTVAARPAAHRVLSGPKTFRGVALWPIPHGLPLH